MLRGRASSSAGSRCGVRPRNSYVRESWPSASLAQRSYWRMRSRSGGYASASQAIWVAYCPRAIASVTTRMRSPKVRRSPSTSRLIDQAAAVLVAETGDVALDRVPEQDDRSRLRCGQSDHRRRPCARQVLRGLLADELALGSREVAVVRSDQLVVGPRPPETVEEMQLRALLGWLHDVGMLFDQSEPPGRSGLLSTEDDEIRSTRAPALRAGRDVRERLEHAPTTHDARGVHRLLGLGRWLGEPQPATDAAQSGSEHQAFRWGVFQGLGHDTRAA